MAKIQNQFNQNDSQLKTPARGDDLSYSIYYSSMDATAQIKVAATTPHIPLHAATVVDFGMGTGSTSFDLANLSPHNKIIGVDFDPKSIEHAQARYARPNLKFVQGDIGKIVFEPESIDVAFYSSVLHEMPCYCDSAELYSFNPVARVLDSAQKQLKIGGKIIIRDFVAPVGPAEVILQMNNEDGLQSGIEKELSTAALFQRFIASFRSARFPQGGIESLVQQVDSARNGWKSYRLPLPEAAEFILRRAYVDRWSEELRESYNFWTQAQAEDEISKRGFRIVIAQENHNLWRHQHHFEGRFCLSDLDGRKLSFPPTNFTLVAEKVAPNHGVKLKCSNLDELSFPDYLKIRKFAGEANTQQLYYEMVERPNPVVDVVPWFKKHEDIFVLIKSGYPRPLVALASDAGLLDRSSTSGYVAEPIAISSVETGTDGRISNSALNPEFTKRTGLKLPKDRDSFEHQFCSSPGGISELVISRLVRIEADPQTKQSFEPYSNFSTSGEVRAIEGRQLLRAAQTGGMFDSRLEIAVYNLLNKEKSDWGPWIGFKPALHVQDLADINLCSFTQLLDSPRKVFKELKANQECSFLSVKSGRFSEFSASNNKLAEVELEFVEPKTRSNATFSVLPVIATHAGILVGIEKRDLPAAQIHFDSSLLPTVPAFRLSKAVRNMEDGIEELKARFKNDFHAELRNITPLGGKYFPCSGASPEIVYPFIAEISPEILNKTNSTLSWIKLEELLKNAQQIRDGHLLTSVYRAAHLFRDWNLSKSLIKPL